MAIKVGEELKAKVIPLTGKWRPALDGTQLEEGDFQTLQNMRYADVGIQSIHGHSIINSAGVTSKPKFKSGIHYQKSQPSENHILVQAYDVNDANSVVIQNTTTIPNAGNFSGGGGTSPTALFTDSSGAGAGRFSLAPDGCVAYCNGVDAAIWGGNQYRVGNFLIGDDEATVFYDYTDVINNTITDANNVAIMHSTAAANPTTLLNLHLDNNVTDSSPATPHTMTNTNMTFNSTTYKFGGYSGSFDGTAQLRTDNGAGETDFNLSGGIWTFDAWIYPNNITATQTLYSCGSAANNRMYIRLENYSATLGKIVLYIVNAGVVQVNEIMIGITASTWNHIRIQENGNTYYFYLNGVVQWVISTVNRAADYSGANNHVYIGCASDHLNGAETLSNYFNGLLEEVSLFSSALSSTPTFTPPVSPFGSDATYCYLYLGSTRPIQGVKFNIQSANAAAATSALAYYWANGGWNAVSSLVDGTASGGITLAQTGSITFTSTVTTAKPRYFYGTYAYWYLFIFGKAAATGITATTSVSYVTVDAPMQQIVDLWDGVPRAITSCFKYDGTTWLDASTNVFQEEYDSSDPLTYLDISSLATTGYIVAGFAERMAGIKISLAPGQVNAAAVLSTTISYWNGSAWIPVTGQVDTTTINSNISMGVSGVIYWEPPNEISEFTTSIQSGDMWHYYKIAFSATMEATVAIDFISGIPAPKTIRRYKFPFTWQNRLGLGCNSDKEKNSILIGGMNQVCVFNGTDSTKLFFGDESEITAAVPFYTRYGSNIFESLLVAKANEIWLVDGYSPSTYKIYKISDMYGCNAPETMRVCSIGYEVAPGLNKHVVVWQSGSGLVLFDGSTIIPIHKDIENYFNPVKSEAIRLIKADLSVGFYDQLRREYHWLFASGSSDVPNNEIVYDLNRKKFFLIVRNSPAKALRYGLNVSDTYGNQYCYGFVYNTNESLNNGYLLRLENGNYFEDYYNGSAELQTDAISSIFKTPDIALSGLAERSEIRKMKHLAISASNAMTATLTHFHDAIVTATDANVSLSAYSSTNRIANSNTSMKWHDGLFHSLSSTVSHTGDTNGYQPIGLVVFYRSTHIDDD